MRRRKIEEVFKVIENDLLIEADIKHARQHIRVPITSMIQYLMKQLVKKFKHLI